MDTSNWPTESWSAVVDVLTADPGVCAAPETYVVVPFDAPNSIMVQKLRGTQTCGTEMPPGQLISESLVQVVEEWVALGAPNN